MGCIVFEGVSRLAYVCPEGNMNSLIVGLRVAGTVFGIVGLGHLLRLLMRWEFLIAGWQVPFWLSGLGLVFAGGMSLWMWKLAWR